MPAGWNALVSHENAPVRAGSNSWSAEARWQLRRGRILWPQNNGTPLLEHVFLSAGRSPRTSPIHSEAPTHSAGCRAVTNNSGPGSVRSGEPSTATLRLPILGLQTSQSWMKACLARLGRSETLESALDLGARSRRKSLMSRQSKPLPGLARASARAARRMS